MNVSNRTHDNLRSSFINSAIFWALAMGSLVCGFIAKLPFELNISLFQMFVGIALIVNIGLFLGLELIQRFD